MSSLRPQMSPCASVVPLNMDWPPKEGVALTEALAMGLPKMSSTVKLTYHLTVRLFSLSLKVSRPQGTKLPSQSIPERLMVVFTKVLFCEEQRAERLPDIEELNMLLFEDEKNARPLFGLSMEENEMAVVFVMVTLFELDRKMAGPFVAYAVTFVMLV